MIAARGVLGLIEGTRLSEGGMVVSELACARLVRTSAEVGNVERGSACHGAWQLEGSIVGVTARSDRHVSIDAVTRIRKRRHGWQVGYRASVRIGGRTGRAAHATDGVMRVGVIGRGRSMMVA